LFLKIVRDGLEDPIEIPIVRGNVKVKSVKYTDIEDGYAYVRLTNFIENTAQDLQAVLDKHLSKHKKIEGLLIDLRRNPGGLLDQAVKVSDLFIKEGVIVSTIGRDRSKKEVVNASKKAKFSDVPVVVLLNEFSASASEIVAGALQDNKRALIVGTRSFGKGSVQSVIRLNDGSGMKMTIARYYTPSGISIQAEGIKPDIEIEDVDSENFSKLINKSKGQREKDIIGHLRGDREGDTDEDSQSSKEAKKKSISDESGTMAWWKSVTSKDEKQLNDKEKLFRKDYQAYQAFGYLKAISKNPQR
jgi:carboxyl-terminal processing protease